MTSPSLSPSVREHSQLLGRGSRGARSLAGSTALHWLFAESLCASAVLACLLGFFSWGLNLNCKGSTSSQGTGREGHFGTGPQPDLAGVHPVSLAPMGARISLPQPPAGSLRSSLCEPCACHPAWMVLLFLSQREGRQSAGLDAPNSFIHSLTHSTGITHSMSDPSSGSVLNYSLCLRRDSLPSPSWP